MSVRAAEDVMRRALRFFSGPGFLWQPRVLAKSSSPCKTPAHVWDVRRSRTYLARGLASSVRFYSQGRIRSDEEQELFSALAESSLSTEATSEQRRRRGPLMEELQNCGSPSDVLDLTCKYAVTVRQVSNCLSRMWFSTKMMSDEQRRYELQLMFEHPALEQLLQKAMKGALHMQNESLAYSLLSLVKLGVPQQSRVVQTLLRTCQVKEKINNRSEHRDAA